MTESSRAFGPAVKSHVDFVATGSQSNDRGRRESPLPTLPRSRAAAWTTAVAQWSQARRPACGARLVLRAAVVLVSSTRRRRRGLLPRRPRRRPFRGAGGAGGLVVASGGGLRRRGGDARERHEAEGGTTGSRPPAAAPALRADPVLRGRVGAYRPRAPRSLRGGRGPADLTGPAAPPGCGGRPFRSAAGASPPVEPRR